MQRFDKDKLRTLRQENGETLDAMAEAVGVTKAALSLIETGSSNPRLETMLKIAKHFNKPLEFFLTDSETTVAPVKAA